MTPEKSRPRVSGGGAPCARGCALDFITAVLRQRRLLGEVLEEAQGAAAKGEGFSALSPRDRAFARLLVATVLRRLGQIDALIDHCLERPLPRKAGGARDILRLGVAQLLFIGTPPHAAVNTSVDLARARGCGPHAKLINAVLRRLTREGAALIGAQDAPRLNTPDWLWDSWVDAYGEEKTRAIAEIHLEEPPLDLSTAGDCEGWAERLGGFVLPTGNAIGETSGSVRLAAGVAVPDLAGYAAGAWWVQDAASALPARLLCNALRRTPGGIAGKTVVDLCAAPGGKTAQLAAAGAADGIKVIAIERSRKRLRRLEENLERLRLDVETICADAAEWRARADAILLDAPCTATGTLRRHPDVARRKSPADVARLSARQDRLLDSALSSLAAGGILVFCTCSLEPQEGPERIAALFARAAPVERVPVAPDEVGNFPEFITELGDLRTLPCHLRELGGIDGFYAARLRRL